MKTHIRANHKKKPEVLPTPPAYRYELAKRSLTESQLFHSNLAKICN
ncbi:MAG: hypothetical protein JWP71_1188 [Mucilaginibacter sp.]|nr:hypothetical protein [Mucilaginibacter sp.]